MIPNIKMKKMFRHFRQAMKIPGLHMVSNDNSYEVWKNAQKEKDLHRT